MKKWISLLLIVLALTALFSCSCKKNKNPVTPPIDGGEINNGDDNGDDTQPIDVVKTLNKEYVLKAAFLDGKNVTSNFGLFSVTFKDDLTMKVVINYNFPIIRTSTYEILGSVIMETYGKQTYQYTIIGDNLFTTYDDLGDIIEITLKPKEEENMNNAVEFDSLLFGEDISLTKKYNYCPAIIYDTEDGQQIMHVWYCTNRDSGVMMDYIGYRKGIQQEDGKWLFSDEEIVLSPTSETWDARHTCDPSVIKGEFNYHDVKYYYLMAYLGCTSEDYQKNETGFALSVTPYGPWVKIDEINPIVPWYDDGNIEVEEAKYQSYKGTSTIYWGTGMPSLVSIDGKGRFLLFYQSTLRGTGIKEIDLTNAAEPIVKYTSSLTSKNIVNSQSQNCRIGIPDFAYDPVNKRFYVTSVTNERNPADVTLTRVNSHSFVAYLENIESMEDLATLLNGGTYSWKIVGYIGPNETGWERNHNPGIVKDCYGRIPDANKIQVIVSTGHNSWANENIFTYRLYGHTFIIA